MHSFSFFNDILTMGAYVVSFQETSLFRLNPEKVVTTMYFVETVDPEGSHNSNSIAGVREAIVFSTEAYFYTEHSTSTTIVGELQRDLKLEV